MIDIPEQRQFSITKPSPYDEFENIIKPDIYEQWLNEFPPEELFKDEFPETRKHGQRPHCRKFMCYTTENKMSYFNNYMINLSDLPNIWTEFSEYIYNDRDYKQWIADMLKIKNFYFRFDFHRTQNGLDVSPHVDSHTKFGSHLFYFMPEGWKEEYGGQTIFYEGLNKNVLNPEAEDFSSYTTTTTSGNRSCLFKNVPNGWHGVTRINTPVGIVRQIFNLVILKRM